MPAALADGSDVLQIGAEWQRQQNDVHHHLVGRREEQVGILDKWGEKETGRQKSLPTLL